MKKTDEIDKIFKNHRDQNRLTGNQVPLKLVDLNDWQRFESLNSFAIVIWFSVKNDQKSFSFLTFLSSLQIQLWTTCFFLNNVLFFNIYEYRCYTQIDRIDISPWIDIGHMNRHWSHE